MSVLHRRCGPSDKKRREHVRKVARAHGERFAKEMDVLFLSPLARLEALAKSAKKGDQLFAYDHNEILNLVEIVKLLEQFPPQHGSSCCAHRDEPCCCDLHKLKRRIEKALKEPKKP